MIITVYARLCSRTATARPLNQRHFCANATEMRVFFARILNCDAVALTFGHARQTGHFVVTNIWQHRINRKMQRKTAGLIITYPDIELAAAFNLCTFNWRGVVAHLLLFNCAFGSYDYDISRYVIGVNEIHKNTVRRSIIGNTQVQN